MTDRIRTRFAPSPTGYMHIGNLRTALYAYLFAKANKGDFLLRIEDTDQKRFVADAVDFINRTLASAHIVPNEGPDIGGDCGPYIQSQRLDIYKSMLRSLLPRDTLTVASALIAVNSSMRLRKLGIPRLLVATTEPAVICHRKPLTNI